MKHCSVCYDTVDFIRFKGCYSLRPNDTLESHLCQNHYEFLQEANLLNPSTRIVEDDDGTCLFCIYGTLIMTEKPNHEGNLCFLHLYTSLFHKPNACRACHEHLRWNLFAQDIPKLLAIRKSEIGRPVFRK